MFMFICPRRQYQHIFLNFVYISRDTGPKGIFFLVLFKTGRYLLVLRMCCGYVPDTVLIVLLTRRAYRLDHVLWMFLVNINTVVVICTQIHRDTHTN